MASLSPNIASVTPLNLMRNADARMNQASAFDSADGSESFDSVLAQSLSNTTSNTSHASNGKPANANKSDEEIETAIAAPGNATEALMPPAPQPTPPALPIIIDAAAPITSAAITPSATTNVIALDLPTSTGPLPVANQPTPAIELGEVAKSQVAATTALADSSGLSGIAAEALPAQPASSEGMNVLSAHQTADFAGNGKNVAMPPANSALSAQSDTSSPILTTAVTPVAEPPAIRTTDAKFDEVLNLQAGNQAGNTSLLPATGGSSNPVTNAISMVPQTMYVNNLTATADTTHVIAPRIGTHSWSQSLGDQMIWMAGRQLQTAQLILNPPDLGPMQITLTLNNDQATAQFVSSHSMVREALETALPKLREMLAESGITLGQANVSAESFKQPQFQQSEQSASNMPRSSASIERDMADVDTNGISTGVSTWRTARGLIDTFA